jgi:hypothetical protein
MAIDIKAEVDAVQQIGAVPKILDVVGRITGMGFVAIARVKFRPADIREGDGEPVRAVHARGAPQPAGPGARALYRLADRKGAWWLTDRHFESARDEIRFRDAAAERLDRKAGVLQMDARIRSLLPSRVAFHALSLYIVAIRFAAVPF